MDDSINNRNNTTTRFNVARDNNINGKYIITR